MNWPSFFIGAFAGVVLLALGNLIALAWAYQTSDSSGDEEGE